jgi:hypothetical protein
VIRIEAAKAASSLMKDFKRLDKFGCIVLTVQVAVAIDELQEAEQVIVDAIQSYGAGEIIEKFAVSNTLEEAAAIIRSKIVK